MKGRSMAMLGTIAEKEPRVAAFAEEYRDLQCVISRLSGDPPPPCFFCPAKQLWNCSQTGMECGIFKLYTDGK